MKIISKSILSLLFLLLISPVAFSQIPKLKGVVISKDDGLVIPNVQISILDPGNRAILDYTFSRSDGSFVIQPKKEFKNFILEASALGFTKYSRGFDAVPQDVLRIELLSSAISLREVLVKAPKISVKGDTLNFMTAGLAKEQDMSVEDVIKRIPGVVVLENGQINYNDKPINALYIDGKNLLEGQYSLATRNIKPSLVSLIQVFENHQPIKVLKKRTLSENAAINLKLDPKAKSRWILSADLGAGFYPFLWDSRILLFQFGSRSQSLNILKSNSIGKDIKWELRNQSLGAAAETQLISQGAQNIVNVTGIDSPPVGDERSMFNKSVLASSGSLFSLGPDLQATLKANYIYDRQERWQSERTEYFIEGANNIVIEEENSFRGYLNAPEIDFTLKSNSEKFFLQNRINGSARFSSGIANTSGTNSVEQTARLHQYDVSEIFSFIRPMKKWLFKANSNTQLQYLPQSLNIPTESVNQSVNLFQIRTNNILSFQRTAGKFTSDFSGGYNFKYQNLVSDLSVFDESNDLKWNFSELFVSAGLKYESDALRVSVTAPVKIQNGRLRFSPSLSLKYAFSPFWELSGGYVRSASQTDIMDMNSSPVMVNYRSFIKGYDKMLESSSDLYSVRLQYSNPLQLINVSGSASYNSNDYGYTTSMEYAEFYNTRIILPLESLGSALNFTGNITKSFFDLPLFFELRGSYTILDSYMVQQGVPSDFKTNILSLSPKAEVTLWRDLNIDFISRISFSRRFFGDNPGEGSMLSDYNPKMVINYKFSDKINAKVNFDLYINELTSGAHSVSNFTDLRAVYKIKKGELSLDWRNIFNNREYSYSRFSGLSTVDRQFRLRPLTIMIGYSFEL